MSPDETYQLLTNGDQLPLEQIIGETAARLVREYIQSAMVTEDDLTILANAVRKLQPEQTLEIGLASASTAIAIMASKPVTASSLHIALDPSQTKDYKNVGVDRIKQADLQGNFRLIESPSYIGLPLLLINERKVFDFVFIDGSHMFDHTLLEWFYADKMLKVGGVIAFDDVVWAMVHSVVNFIEANCAYKFVKPNNRTWLAVKQSEDARPWFDFKPFEIPWGAQDKGMIDLVREQSRA